MATHLKSRKLRHRTLDRLRQKLWAVPAHLRLKVAQRGSAKRPAGYRTDYLR
jgi:hypothetical protein